MGRRLAGKRHTARLTRFDDPSLVGAVNWNCIEEINANKCTAVNLAVVLMIVEYKHLFYYVATVSILSALLTCGIC